MTSRATGRVWRRCGCRREDGTKWGANCPKLGGPKHGAWAFRVDAGLDDAGKRREVMKGGFPSERAAKIALAKVVASRADGQLRHDGRQTVGGYLESWLADKLADGELRPSTALNYSRYVQLDLVPKLGRVRLSELRAPHVKELMRTLRSEGRGEPTIRQIVAVLRSAMTSARRDGLILTNPVSDVSLGSQRSAKVRPWEPAELGAFLDGIAGHRLAALFELLAFTGVRRGEALGLRWADVDLAEGYLTVRRQLVAVGGKAQEGAPKTRSGEDRRVDLSDHLVGVLLAHQLAQQAEREEWGDRYLDGDRVFATEDGRDLDPGWVTKEFRRLVAQAGLRQIRLHDLRHGSASMLLAAGTDVAVVNKLLGHSSVRITSDTYSHLLRGTGRAAAEAVSALVPRGTRTPGPLEAVAEPSAGTTRAPGA